MAERTHIEWCDATFNPWVGCEKVSAACDHCYAESWAKRTGHPELWNGVRRRTSEGYWKQPLRWNEKAKADGRRMRVFCASLADVFDDQVEFDWLVDLWCLIAETPRLNWLMVTKRPQNISKMLPAAYVEQILGLDAPWGDGWPNVWLGATAENQEEADNRIPHLLHVPARIRFLSCEPLLEDLYLIDDYYGWPTGPLAHRGIDWVISGDESGPHARETKPEWRRSLRDQCRAAGVSFFQKQITVRGRKVPFDDWPEDIKVREFPADAA